MELELAPERRHCISALFFGQGKRYASRYDDITGSFLYLTWVAFQVHMCAEESNIRLLSASIVVIIVLFVRIFSYVLNFGV